jgi:hypothetical protein
MFAYIHCAFSSDYSYKHNFFIFFIYPNKNNHCQIIINQVYNFKITCWSMRRNVFQYFKNVLRAPKNQIRKSMFQSG